MNTQKLAQDLMDDEDIRVFAYDDETGKALQPGQTLKGNLTIGIGRNLTANGLRQDEISYLLQNDIAEVLIGLEQALPWWPQLDDVRQRVLANMAFNMGVAGLLEFKTTLRLVRDRQYAEAARQMLASKWAKQVPSRAAKLAERMRLGKD